MTKSTLNPKREAEITHRIAALSFSLINAFDELKAETPFASEFKNEASSFIDKCEKILDQSYGVKTISAGNYLPGLSNKIDTVVRRNFEQIKE